MGLLAANRTGLWIVIKNVESGVVRAEVVLHRRAGVGACDIVKRITFEEFGSDFKKLEIHHIVDYDGINPILFGIGLPALGDAGIGIEAFCKAGGAFLNVREIVGIAGDSICIAEAAIGLETDVVMSPGAKKSVKFVSVLFGQSLHFIVACPLIDKPAGAGEEAAAPPGEAVVDWLAILESAWKHSVGKTGVGLFELGLGNAEYPFGDLLDTLLAGTRAEHKDGFTHFYRDFL